MNKHLERVFEGMKLMGLLFSIVVLSFLIVCFIIGFVSLFQLEDNGIISLILPRAFGITYFIIYVIIATYFLGLISKCQK